MESQPGADKAARLLNLSVAAVWLATGVLVLHPTYRAEGALWLEPLGLPWWVMVPACAAEVVLALRVARGPTTRLVAGIQTAAVLFFTAVLALTEPLLLAHPFGVLTKNLPLLAAVWAAWALHREGWSPRAVWGLRVGMALIWITEGLFPKVFFQQPMEIVLVESVLPVDGASFLVVMGLAQALSGVLALVLRGRALAVLLGLQVGALILLPILVSWHDPSVWVHPFGPMTKNLPILAGTFLLARRAWSR
ncbi:MAG: hypothetical protein GY913_04430 [Proteobacteria bacterium]|nr:hypothetical protein [Pseudomonadota bacterium]MCP4916148.1 hypothetical protein [Pseudomonadota bacterium]